MIEIILFDPLKYILCMDNVPRGFINCNKVLVRMKIGLVVLSIHIQNDSFNKNTHYLGKYLKS